MSLYLDKEGFIYYDKKNADALKLKADISDLAAVAISGSYNDLIDKPNIPTTIQSDWNQTTTTAIDYIKNKPTRVSLFTNDAGYLTQHQDISGKANSSDLATVATSGSYNDLSNKPTIPDELSDLTSDSTHRTVTDAEKSTWNNKQNAISDLNTIRSGAAAGATAYQKPNTGIPKTDLATAVQTSLSLADTALQAHQDISGKADKTATVSNIAYDTTNKKLTKTINGTSSDVATAAKIVADGGGITQHQDITGKEDKSNKVTTISSSSTDDQYPSAKAVHDALQDVSDTRISMQEFVAQGVAGQEAKFDNRANFLSFSAIQWNSIKDQVKLDYTPVPIGDPQLKNIIVGLYGGETGGSDNQCYVRGVPGIKGEITVSQAAVVYLPGAVFKDVRGIRSFPEKSYFFEVRFGDGGIAEYEGDTLEEVELGYWDRYYQRMPFSRTEKPALRKIVINCDVCSFWYNPFISNAPKLEYIEASRLKVVGNLTSYAFLGANTNVTKLSFPAVEECYMLEGAAEKLKVVDLGENVHTVEVGFIAHYYNEPTVLESVIVRAVTPPKVVNSSGNEISDTSLLILYSGATAPTLYVPDTSVSAYKAHSCWKLGWADIKGISEYSE